MVRTIAIVGLTLAVIASIFAIWPVVADAPWEDAVPEVEESRGDELRCEAALSLKGELELKRADTRRRSILDILEEQIVLLRKRLSAGNKQSIAFAVDLKELLKKRK